MPNPPPPPLRIVLRVVQEQFTVTCPVSLMKYLREMAPHPPPHPMITGTITGATLRLLNASPLLGKEITLPPPHQRWHDVPQPRWASVWLEAREHAIACESFAQLRDKPYDPGALNAHVERLQST